MYIYIYIYIYIYLYIYIYIYIYCDVSYFYISFLLEVLERRVLRGERKRQKKHKDRDTRA